MRLSRWPRFLVRFRAPLPGLLLLALGIVSAAPARTAARRVETPIKVERVPPKKETLSTLRFLKDNRDFLRARFDVLEEKALAQRATATEIDPRYLAYPELLAQILAARDSVASAEDARAQRHLLESITQLGDLETQLYVMERLLLEQRNRLGALEQNFIGAQQTALMIVLSGYPSGVALTEVAVTVDDGATVRVPLSDEQRAALKRGAVVEVYHAFAEPREQVVQIGLSGEPWPAGEAGFVTLHPMRDRLTFLRLDLSELQPAQGGASIRASSWLYDAETHSVDG